MRVTDPDGVEWEISRAWLELPRWRHRGRVSRDLGAGGFPDVDPGDVGAAGAIVLLVVLFVLLLNGLALLVGLAALVVAFGGLLVRVLFGRPWIVEAKSERGELAWRVRGTRGSRRALHELAAALRRGDRSYSPAGAERVLPASPLGGHRQSSVRIRP